MQAPRLRLQLEADKRDGLLKGYEDQYFVAHLGFLVGGIGKFGGFIAGFALI